MYAMTAAHKQLPLPTYVRVTNLKNQRSIVVRVNDRGPFHEGRVIDLSYTGAQKLDMVRDGTAPVEVRALVPEPRRRSLFRAAIFLSKLVLFGDAANAARLGPNFKVFPASNQDNQPKLRGSSCIVFVLVLLTPSQWPTRW